MILGLLFLVVHCAWSVTISHLEVENLRNPVGISVTTKPRFSWTLLDLTSTTRSQSQSAFQILVCSSPQCTTGDVWDSGRVPGTKPFLNEYGGPNPLRPSTKYFWKVRVWDQTGTATGFSEISSFVTSISDFSGSSWITGGYAPNQYRTEFTAYPGAVQSAFVHIVGIGYFDFLVNGQRVNDHMLSPGWTDYRKRSYSVTYDLSEFIIPGQRNAIAITLGNSWFSCAGGQPGCVNTPPQLLVSGSIATTQGRVYVNTSTTTWKVSPGPITYNSLYNGEHYDARAETPGWTMPGFDDSRWARPTMASVIPERISPQVFEPIRKLTRFSPRTISQPFQGVYVLDFGQNMAGLVSIVIRNCLRGQNVTLRHAELLTHPPYGPVDGSIYVGNLRSAKATDIYTCKGTDDGIEWYSPRFTQHGFRFVEITGLSQVLVEDDITADEMHTDVREVGELNSPVNLLNKIQHNTVWGQKSNLMSVPTDCPQRDERRGWMGDAALTSEEALLNFEMSAFYTGWLDIIRDDQNSDGSVNNFVPNVGDTSDGAPNWQTAYPTLLWSLLKYRGDTGIIKNHWTALQRYLAFFDGQYKRTGLKNFFTGFGDWVPPPPQPMANGHYVAAFSYCRDIQLFADFALAVEDFDAYENFQTRLGALRDEYNQAFYDPKTHQYVSGLQTENAMALWLGFVPESDTQLVLSNLINDIQQKNSGHPTTGILGWKFMLEALSKYGRGDVALNMNLIDTYPSIGFMIQGAGNPEPATTIWELWDSYTEGPGMNSRNHIMFGSVGSWLYKGLIGFDIASPKPGYVNIGADPSIVGIGNLTSVTARTRVPYGDISVNWWIENPPHLCQWDTESTVVNVDCPSSTISKVVYAFYGTPEGDCTQFRAGKCDSPNAKSRVEAACLGKQSCQFVAGNAFFGGDPCINVPKYFALKFECAKSVLPFHQDISVPFGQLANVNIPVVPSLGQNLANLVVSEGGVNVWQNGRFVPGVSGISSAMVNQQRNGVVFTVGSGNYKFNSFGQN